MAVMASTSRALLALLAAANLAAAVAPIIPGKGFDRFITIWLENQDFPKVEKDPAFAELAKQGILQTNYFAQTHPSQPNYLAAIGGDYWGLDHDDFVRVDGNVSTIVDLLEPRNITWGGYFEGIPGPGYMHVGSIGHDGKTWDYVRKHNPFVSYNSINNNGTRLAHIQAFDDFNREKGVGALPQFIFMSPNMLNDGHNTTLDYATKWSAKFLEPLLKQDAFKEKTLIQLTYDETEDYSKPNRIASLLLGNAIPDNLRGTKDDTFYTHYSILSTMENNWGLHNLGRYDVGANVFQILANTTGYVNKDPPNRGSVNNSISEPGPLNTQHEQKWKNYPPPNLQLTGAGGLPVLDAIRENFKDNAGATPYDGSGNVYDGDTLPVMLPSEEGRDGGYGILTATAFSDIAILKLSIFWC